MTLEEEMLLSARDCETFKDCLNKAFYFGGRIRRSDPVFWGIDKILSGYGTYRVRITFANEYHFGRKLAEALKNDTHSIITHDKERQYTLDDFEGEIDQVCFAIISDAMEGLELTSRPTDYC